MTEVDLDRYTGRLRRRCPECGVEVEIERPARVLSRTSERAWRRAFRREVQNQILFEALCPDCREWWNSLLARLDEQYSPTLARR